MKQIDRLRNMNSEELAKMIVANNEYLCDMCVGCKNVHKKGLLCDDGIKAWLESEVEND